MKPVGDLQRVKVPQRFIGFVAVGLASTCFNLGSRYGFELFSSYEAAVAAAYVVGILSAFFMNRWFVFRSMTTSCLPQLLKFTSVNLVGMTVGWLCAVGLYRVIFPKFGFTWHPDLMAHAIGIAVPVIPHYLAHRHWTFSRR